MINIAPKLKGGSIELFPLTVKSFKYDSNTNTNTGYSAKRQRNFVFTFYGYCTRWRAV